MESDKNATPLYTLYDKNAISSQYSDIAAQMQHQKTEKYNYGRIICLILSIIGISNTIFIVLLIFTFVSIFSGGNQQPIQQLPCIIDYNGITNEYMIVNDCKNCIIQNRQDQMPLVSQCQYKYYCNHVLCPQ